VEQDAPKEEDLTLPGWVTYHMFFYFSFEKKRRGPYKLSVTDPRVRGVALVFNLENASLSESQNGMREFR
jgi:hypothetical protein